MLKLIFKNLLIYFICFPEKRIAAISSPANNNAPCTQISVCGFWASLVFFWGQGSCSDTWQHYATVLISCSQLCQTLSWGLQRQWRAQLANISHPKAFSKVLVMFLGTVQWLNGALRAAWSLTTLSSEAAKCWGQIMMLSISAFPEQVVKIHSITPLTEASTAAGYKTA